MLDEAINLKVGARLGRLVGAGNTFDFGTQDPKSELCHLETDYAHARCVLMKYSEAPPMERYVPPIRQFPSMTEILNCRHDFIVGVYFYLYFYS